MRAGRPNGSAAATLMGRATETQLPQSNRLTDLLAPGLEVVFCGINPGSRAALSGHHFDGRSNRFWRVLHQAGFTTNLLTPAEDASLIAHGYGLTTVVDRCTARARDLASHEFAAAAESFKQKMKTYRPHRLAFLGKAAYAGMTSQRQVEWGRQQEAFDGVETWVLPNPSGLNRAFSIDALVDAYQALREAIKGSSDAIE